MAIVRCTLGPVAKQPPAAFKIFRFGENQTRQGSFFMDTDGAAQIMAAWKQHGVDLSIDYEHQALQTPPVEAPAAGWFDLEVRPDGLWATNVRWTPRAQERLKQAEYRYYSPAFATEKRKDGKKYITEIVNMALTNVPATDDQQALVAAKAVPYSKYPLVEEGEWDGSAAEQRVKDWASQGEQMDFAKYALAFTWFDADNPEALEGYKLPHHDVSGGELDTVRAGVIAAGNVVSDSRGGVDIPDSDMAAVRAHLAAHYKEFGLIPPWEEEGSLAADEECDPETDDNCDEEGMYMEMKALNVALGLKAEAKEGEALGEVVSLQGHRREIIKLTGADSIEASLGVVAAWKESHEKLGVVAAELAEVKKAKDESERAAIVDKLCAPKDEEKRTFLMGLSKVQLEGYSKTHKENEPGRVRQLKVASSDSVMTDDATSFTRKMGVTSEDLQKYNAAKTRV